MPQKHVPGDQKCGEDVLRQKWLGMCEVGRSSSGRLRQVAAVTTDKQK